MSDTPHLKDSTDPGAPDDAATDDELEAELARLRAAAERPAFSVRVLGGVLAVGGLVGFWAALRLLLDYLLTLEDPDAQLGCNLSVFIQCGAAMGSWQGSLLGFPNPVVGVAAFPVVVTIGVVVLAGFRPAPWFWRSLLAVSTVAIGFIGFAMWTSLYALNALCPWCMLVWAVMIPIYWLQLVHALQERILPAPDALRRLVVDHRWIGLAVIYAGVVVWIFAVMGSDLTTSIVDLF
ncbi:putative membrane protein [Sediminihabitans luteus]|uniref:Putative membrane protein n=1 Tax=Sediminihabitans luteus TaxID=1138585 RepID=A0A2M9CPT4_9CELL|nr:vitamin K epoxide reductase family protein [Sediminihabitans luteus]PJJ73910.1 putative membrane protein [Sediminihabitans luteus]GII98177.1 hypothetical protein Slu03_05550 [Sediminihabitans luteus]